MCRERWLPVIADARRCAIRAAIACSLFFYAGNGAHANPTSDEILVATSARLLGDEGRARLVMDFNAIPDFEVHYLNNPPRVVIDLPAIDYRFDASAFDPKGLFNDVRYGTMAAGRSRIVLSAAKPVRVEKAEVIEDSASANYRFVLDAELTTEEKFKSQIEAQTKNTISNITTASVANSAAEKTERLSEFVIAIDAGHGGIDAGASGVKTNVDEKTITLQFAKELAATINQTPGMKAVLTREKDVFLALSERVALARQSGAQMFLSVHADTLRQKDIRGATIYTLSDKASDRMAQALAERENKSDQIAGIIVTESQPEVADILIDLTRRETQAFSITLAERVLQSFKGNIGVINNPHRHAGFQVLRAHDVPSVLLELGFLSNEEDEKQLVDPEWRKKVAELIKTAVVDYKGQTVVKSN